MKPWVIGTEGSPTVCAWGPDTARNDDSCALEQAAFPLRNRNKLGVQIRDTETEMHLWHYVWYQSPADKLLNRMPLMSSRNVSASKATVTVPYLCFSQIS